MKQNSELERIGDILKTLKFNFDEDVESKKIELMSKWKEVVGEKLSQYSKPVKIDDSGVMQVSCKNSVVSNELFNQRVEINKKLKIHAKTLEVEFKYIRLTK